jgi:TRAP-type C4-dicarboxylate transport system permease small subunit
VRAQLLRITRDLERIAVLSCQFAILLMTGLVLIQVVLRYVFRAPLPWVEEASVFLMIWMTFVGAGVAIRQGAHIAMTLLLEHLPRRITRPLFLCSQVVMLAFLLVLIWEGWQLVVAAQGQRSPALAIPMAIPYFTMPFGACFMVIQILAVLLESRSRADAPAEVI